jgi:hypothetical protein
MDQISFNLKDAFWPGLAVDRYGNDAPRVERESGDLLTLGPYASEVQ